MTTLTAVRYLSLADAKSVGQSSGRKGSSSSRIQASRAETPDIFTSSPQKPRPPQQSNILKAMDHSGFTNEPKTPVKIDQSTVYLEDIEVGLRGCVLVIYYLQADTYLVTLPANNVPPSAN